jgi:hypothetical protein
MTNRRDDEFAYGGPSRSGVIWAAGLVLLAVIAGVLVLQKVDNRTVSVAGNEIAPAETTAVTDSTLAATDPAVTPTTLASPAAPRTAAQVRVIVTNGSGVNKAARRVNEALVPSGYQMVSPRDANTSNKADAVFYKPGFEAEANAIAAGLGVNYVSAVPADEQTIKTPPAIPEFDVQVMVGPMLAAKYLPGGAAATPATTPAAATPTP